MLLSVTSPLERENSTCTFSFLSVHLLICSTNIWVRSWAGSWGNRREEDQWGPCSHGAPSSVGETSKYCRTTMWLGLQGECRCMGVCTEGPKLEGGGVWPTEVVPGNWCLLWDLKGEDLARWRADRGQGAARRGNSMCKGPETRRSLGILTPVCATGVNWQRRPSVGDPGCERRSVPTQLPSSRHSAHHCPHC